MSHINKCIPFFLNHFLLLPGQHPKVHWPTSGSIFSFPGFSPNPTDDSSQNHLLFSVCEWISLAPMGTPSVTIHAL